MGVALGRTLREFLSCCVIHSIHHQFRGATQFYSVDDVIIEIV